MGRSKHHPLTRSEIMSRVGQRDTGPELLLRSALFAAGLRFRLNVRVEGVRPDIVYGPKHVAVFVDGCFWHGCPLHGTKPGSNQSYWLPKLEANRARDARQTEKLERAGWTVIRLWEHECKPPDPLRVQQILSACRS